MDLYEELMERKLRPRTRGTSYDDLVADRHVRFDDLYDSDEPPAEDTRPGIQKKRIAHLLERRDESRRRARP